MDMSEEVKVAILLMLYNNPRGVQLAELPLAFYMCHGYPLDLSSFDHSLYHLVEEMADMVELWFVGGEEMLFPRGLAGAGVCSNTREHSRTKSGPSGLAKPKPFPCTPFPRPWLQTSATELHPHGPLQFTLPQCSGLVQNRASASRPQADGQWERSLLASGLPVSSEPEPWPAQFPKPVCQSPDSLPTQAGMQDAQAEDWPVVAALAKGPHWRRQTVAAPVVPAAIRDKGQAAFVQAGALQEEAGADRPLTYSQALQASPKVRHRSAPGGKQAVRHQDPERSPALNTERPRANTNRRPRPLLGRSGEEGKPGTRNKTWEPRQTTEQPAAMMSITSRAQEAMDGGELAEWLLDVLKTKGYRDGLRVQKLARLSLVQKRQELTEMLMATGYPTLSAFLADLPQVEMVTSQGAPNNFVIRLRPSARGTSQQNPTGEAPLPCSPTHISSPSVMEKWESSRSEARSRVRNSPNASPSTNDSAALTSSSGRGGFRSSVRESETPQQVRDNILHLVQQHSEGLSVFQLQREYARVHHHPLTPLGQATIKELLQGMSGSVCLRGLGVQTRIFPCSTAGTSQGREQSSFGPPPHSPLSEDLSPGSATSDGERGETASLGSGSLDHGRLDTWSAAQEPGPATSQNLEGSLSPRTLTPRPLMPHPPARLAGRCEPSYPLYFSSPSLRTPPPWASLQRSIPGLHTWQFWPGHGTPGWTSGQAFRASSDLPAPRAGRPTAEIAAYPSTLPWASPGLAHNQGMNPIYISPRWRPPPRPPASSPYLHPEVQQLACALL